MPLINVEIGDLTKVQKEVLISKLTADASAITHIPPEFFMVTIHELSDSNIGIGGKSIEITKAEAGKEDS